MGRPKLHGGVTIHARLKLRSFLDERSIKLNHGDGISPPDHEYEMIDINNLPPYLPFCEKESFTKQNGLVSAMHKLFVYIKSLNPNIS